MSDVEPHPSESVPQTPWQRATAKQRSMRSESRGAAAEGGHRVPMSGAGRQKGDIRTSTFLIEDKITDADSYRLGIDDFLKIERESLQTPPGLLPQMRITLGKGDKRRTLRVLSDNDYLAFMAAVSQNFNDQAGAS